MTIEAQSEEEWLHLESRKDAGIDPNVSYTYTLTHDQPPGPLKDVFIYTKWLSYRSSSVDLLNKEYLKIDREWKVDLDKARNYHMWISRLHALKAANIPITNLVVLGLGSFHESHLGQDHAWRHWTTGGQFALIMEIREILGGEP